MSYQTQREALAPLPARRTMGPVTAVPLFQLSPGCMGSTCLIITVYDRGAIVSFTNVAGFETFNIGGFFI